MGDAGLVAADEVVVAPMRRRHLRGVVAIEQLNSHAPWSLGLFMGELRMPTSRSYVVALDGHVVVGYCGLMLTHDEGHVTNVSVHPDHQRRGIAARMMLVTLREGVARGLRSATLEVRVGNVAARELYARFGFAPGGIRRGYYQEVGEDAVIMWAHDIDSPDYAQRLDRIEAALPSPLRIEGAR